METPYVYRNYTYLDGSFLNTIAEDIDMDVKLSYEVVERTTKDKGGKQVLELVVLLLVVNFRVNLNARKRTH